MRGRKGGREKEKREGEGGRREEGRERGWKEGGREGGREGEGTLVFLMKLFLTISLGTSTDFAPMYSKRSESRPVSHCVILPCGCSMPLHSPPKLVS